MTHVNSHHEIWNTATYEIMSIIKENKYKTNGLNCPHIEMKLIQNSFITVWSYVLFQFHFNVKLTGR